MGSRQSKKGATTGVTAILKTPNVPLARAWNTWAADRYLEMSFRPLGIRVTPMVFSARIAKSSFVGPGSDVRLGTHATDGSVVEARLTHGGTTLDWRWRKRSLYDLEGGWTTVEHGEWALRFWVVLLLSSEDGGAFRYDEATSTALVTTPESLSLMLTRENARDELVGVHSGAQLLNFGDSLKHRGRNQQAD